MKLYASTAHIWGPGGCSANPSHELNFGQKKEKSQSRKDGDAAHYVFGLLVQEQTVNAGELDSENNIIDLEMIECGQLAANDILSTQKAQQGTVSTYLEYDFAPAKHIHHANIGRADFVLINKSNKTIFLWEYKYGYRFVDEYMNWQNINAAIGTMNNYKVEENDWPDWEIVATVIQPRCFHPRGSIREWHFSGSQLLQFCKELQNAANAAHDNAIMRTGTHCRDCSGKLSCAAFQQAAQNCIDVSLENAPSEFDAAQAGLLLKNLKAAQTRIDVMCESLEEHVLALFKSGQDVPNWKTDYSQSRKRWIMSKEEVINFGDLLGFDLRKEQEPITPTQAIKLGIDPNLFSSCFTQTQGSIKIVPFDVIDAKRYFN